LTRAGQLDADTAADVLVIELYAVAGPVLTHPWDPRTQCHVCSSGLPAGALAQYAFGTCPSVDDPTAAADATLPHGRTAQGRMRLLPRTACRVSGDRLYESPLDARSTCGLPA